MEIERKWLVSPYIDIFKKLGLERNDGILFEIEQGYSKEIRLRKQTQWSNQVIQYFQTIKKGKGISRMEYEIELTAYQFNKLWPLTEGCRLFKKRRRVELNKHTLEIDCITFIEDFSITLIEIEFNTEDAAKTFVAPEAFGKDVTEDKKYTNYNIAAGGLEGLTVIETMD